MRNPDYWDAERVPKLDKMVVMPMPEPTTRLAALRSGQVDWIEVPPPDAIPGLRQAGFQISLWPYPHTWPYALNAESEKSPFRDKRVRQAINYAVDREGIVKLLNGTAKPAAGLYPPDSAFFGNPQNKYSYNPEKAKALLAEAGYGPKNPAKAKIMISTAGSGQMLPLPMNELIQQTLKPLGIELEFEVVEWGTMLVAMRSAPSAPQSLGVDGVNCSLSFTDPSALYRYYHSDSFSPANWNWGHWKNAEADKLMTAAQTEFDPGKASRAPVQGARHRRRRSRLAVRRARPQSAGHVEEGQRLQSGAKLEPGFYDNQHGLRGSAADGRSTRHCNRGPRPGSRLVVGHTPQCGR